MEKIRKRLLDKGWKKKDIEKAMGIIAHAKRHRHPKIKLLDKAVYWLSLTVAIIGNFIISIALLPFFLASGGQIFLFIAVLGLSFGLLFELLIRGIGNLETSHHLFLGIIIPIMAVINFIIVSNNMGILAGLESRQDPIIIGSVYAIAFILPYIFYRVFLKNK